MGQSQSSDQAARDTSPEALSHELAHKFAEKCFTPLELTHFKDNFRSLADSTDGIQYWQEETLCRFLSIPDALGTGPIIYQMATYLGAFPFPSLAPAILTREAILKVVVMMTERYGKVLKRGLRDRNKLLFRSLAVFDKRLSHFHEKSASPSATLPSENKVEDRAAFVPPPQQHAPGFSVDIAGLDEDDEDDDELALAALDTLDVVDVYKTSNNADFKTQQARIPVDNFRQLLLLLLVIAPLGALEPLSNLAGRVTEPGLIGLRTVADSILWTFAPEQHSGIDYATFVAIVEHSLPYLFEGLSPLFEHFLFSKNLNLSKHRFQSNALSTSPELSNDPALVTPEPLLVSEGDILNLDVLSQLSFFLQPTDLFRRLRLLYSGDDAGFSINSISQKVLNWRAPSILLVSGKRLALDGLSPRERGFVETLPPKKLPVGASGNATDGRVVFGIYLNVPWKQTHKDAIGDDTTLLFQLEPLHDVFHASSLNRDYVTFSKSGIGAGLPPSKKSTVNSSQTNVVLGPVSLFLDENLEFGVFTHEVSGGGAFGTSRVRKSDWQDKFEIDSLEIWGCGGDEEAERQRQAWKWEEREAAARRGLNLGRDKEADYALLEMAGLVGGHSNSGGSMV